MKITYFFRDQRDGIFSIEQIFKAIGQEIGKRHEVYYFYVDSSKSILQNIREARKAQGDINHITGDVNWLAYGLSGSKTVLTIHDLGHFEQTLEGIKKWVYGLLWLRFPMKRVKLVTSISNFTKERILCYFPSLCNKTTVVYNPLPVRFNYGKKHDNTTSPRILQVGGMANKNVDRLIEAVRGLDCTLLLVRKSDDVLASKLNKAGIKYEFHYNLDEGELVELYRSCDLLFFASTYEGFGMPIIEAQAVGVPVLTSNICSMPEVAANGACLVVPIDVAEIRSGVLKIIENSNYSADIVKNGIANVKRFQLKDIANQYLTLYSTILNVK